MKTCCKCKKNKPVSEFGKYAKAKDGLFPQCKDCKREYDKRYYKEKAGRKDSIQKSNEARRQARISIIGEYLSNNHCVDCGESDIRVLDFDHVRGTKVMEVTKLVATTAPIEKIIEEINKCEVRCANCHRKVTADRAGNWRALWKG